jgi:hypothetical protein
MKQVGSLGGRAGIAGASPILGIAFAMPHKRVGVHSKSRGSQSGPPRLTDGSEPYLMFPKSMAELSDH